MTHACFNQIAPETVLFPVLILYLHLECYNRHIVGRKSQTSREPAPPPALGADIDTRNRAVRTSVNLGQYHIMLLLLVM